MLGFKPPLEKWCQISGLDLIRDGKGTWHVLEDNLRCPSGVAYFCLLYTSDAADE